MRTISHIGADTVMSVCSFNKDGWYEEYNMNEK